jgi:hypothetical protein
VAQLPAVDLPLGDQFEPGAMQIGSEATLRRWVLVKKTLKRVEEPGQLVLD